MSQYIHRPYGDAFRYRTEGSAVIFESEHDGGIEIDRDSFKQTVYVRDTTTLTDFKKAVEESKRGYGNPTEYKIEYTPGALGYNWKNPEIEAWADQNLKRY